MKIGISLNPYDRGYGRYGDDKFRIIKRQGYCAADYSLADTDTELYRVNENEIKEKLNAEKALAQSAGIEIPQAHGPWRWPARDSSEQERAERLDKMKKAVCIAALLGCKNLVIHPIMPYGIEDLKLQKEKETHDLNLEFFKKLVAFAKQYDVVICLENMPFRNFSIAKPGEILELVKEINDEHFKICLDTGHVAVFPELSLGDEIRKLGDYIKAFHIHDNMGDADCHLYPTKGIIDWCDFANAIRDIDFNGVLSLETAPSKDFDDARFEQEGAELYKLFNSIIEKSSTDS